MKRRLAASFIFSLMLLTLTGAQTGRRVTGSATETEDYSIDNYELTVETQAGSASVRVTMDITYRIRSGTKSTGFKYIGNYEAEGLSGRDGDGKAIKTSIEHLRDTRINWSFAPAGPGTKRITLSFTVPHAITNGSSDSNQFEAAWAGVFKVPVKNAVYRFVFPDNTQRTVVCTPSDYTARERNSCRSIEIAQAPFKNATFEMTFWPRIVDARSSTASVGQRRSSGSSEGPVFVIVILVIAAVILAGIVSIARKAKRAGTGVAGSSWWSSGSSCAGGSSCSSSSCGSSCGGGGCGGGCGG